MKKLSRFWIFICLNSKELSFGELVNNYIGVLELAKTDSTGTKFDRVRSPDSHHQRPRTATRLLILLENDQQESSQVFRGQTQQGHVSSSEPNQPLKNLESLTEAHLYSASLARG